MNSEDAPTPECPQLPADLLKEQVEQRLARAASDRQQLLEKLADVDGATFVARHIWLARWVTPEHPKIAIVPPDALDPEVEFWFVGDVHGDLLALEAVLMAYDLLAAERAQLVFLGDLFDDGFHGAEVLVRVLGTHLREPGGHTWIAGNHDEALSWSEELERFQTSVKPGEFAEQLNINTNDASLGALGRLAISIIAELPRAIFLPGLLAAHAGFPHTDLQPNLRTPSDLSQLACFRDFVWNRLHESRSKIPNRASSGSEFGAEDFHSFRRVCGAMGLVIDSMVRGHDHTRDKPARWWRPNSVRGASYEERILTVNTLAYTQGREVNQFAPPNPRAPTVARWRPGEVRPTPIELHLPAALVAWYAPICPKCRQPNATYATVCTVLTDGPDGPVPCDTPLPASDV